LGPHAEQRLTDLLADTERQVRMAVAHADLPFREVVAALPERRLSAVRALTNVMFLHNNAPLEAVRWGELHVRRYRLPQVSVKYEWAVMVATGATGVIGALEHTDAFSERTMRTVCERYVRLVELVAAGGGTTVREALKIDRQQAAT
jgi:non-ribosomal peptide synthetase component F